ncbi:MAG: hypothetical protein J6D34_02090 [Atopobiaceae bacterium]|nr:hypothetical protein [Atopobiaceae bacterium]
MSGGRGIFVALALAACLAVPFGQAFAQGNETEMTGGFTPVELGSGIPASSEPAGGEADAGDGQGNEAAGEASGNESELSEDDGSQAQDEGSTDGIRMDDGSVVTVDGDGHLAVASPTGDVRVLDEGHAYWLEHRDDGSTAIHDDYGEEVTVEGRVVSYTGAEGERVSVEVEPASPEQPVEAATEGALVENETELSNEDEVSQEALNAPAKLTGEAKAPVFAIIAVAVAAAVGIVFLQRRSRARNAPKGGHFRT